jgi:RNA polymerase sigma-70 factor (ECF subfamily)
VLEQLNPAELVAFVYTTYSAWTSIGLPRWWIATPGRLPDGGLAEAQTRGADVPRAAASQDEVSQLLDGSTQAGKDGDVAQLVSLLDPDVVIRSDMGGAVFAARSPTWVNLGRRGRGRSGRAGGTR